MNILKLNGIFGIAIALLITGTVQAEDLADITYERNQLRTKYAAAKLKIEKLEREIAKLNKQLAGGEDGTFAPPATTATRPAIPQVLGAGLAKRVVTIERISRSDTASLERQKADMQSQLSKLKTQIIEARAEANKLESENATARKKQIEIAKGKHDEVTSYRSSYSGYRYSYRTKAEMIDLPHAPGAITAAKSKSRALETQSRTLTVKIAKLNTEIKKATLSQSVTGRYDDGTPVSLVFKGTAATLATSIGEGGVYSVTGLERSLAGSKELVVRSLNMISEAPTHRQVQTTTGSRYKRDSGNERRKKKGKYSIYE